MFPRLPANDLCDALRDAYIAIDKVKVACHTKVHKHSEMYILTIEIITLYEHAMSIIANESLALFYDGSPFSQYTYSEFRVNGVMYNCAEQYMMAEKARLFNDFDTFDEIMLATSPSVHTRLGRCVKGFDQRIWDAFKYHIVLCGNKAKFEQNPSFLHELMSTGARVIAEAVEFDRIWGIGYFAYDSNAYRPDKWKGSNLLGQVLMQVRQEFSS